MKRKVGFKDVPDSPNDADLDPFDVAIEENDDDLIQQRRWKRAAILAKHSLSILEEPIESNDSIEELIESNDSLEELNESNDSIKEPIESKDSKEEPIESIDEEDMAAADYNTDLDDESFKKDMFADDFDMFADTLNPDSAHVLDQAPVKRQDHPGLTDNWDDHEGYYQTILGEQLNGRYHVYAHLGKGVFSTVVRAKDTLGDNVDVAIKIIRHNDVMYRAGLKELGILQKLMSQDPNDSNHCIQFLTSFEHKNHLCLVFESLSMNLREVMKKFGKGIGISIKAVRAYALQLFLSLSLLQKCNVLHADIKPDNILVTENKSTLKLADFGSASDASENEITPYLVSRFYRAPEIILGLPYDFALDVWSVGVTLFELYSGKILFPGKSNNQMLRYMMDLKGKFSNKMLRKGQFTSLHFDESFNFLSQEMDRVSGKPFVKTLNVIKPVKDVRERILACSFSNQDSALVHLFVDFMDKILHLQPEKRLTVQDALLHSFLSK